MGLYIYIIIYQPSLFLKTSFYENLTAHQRILLDGYIIANQICILNF